MEKACDTCQDRLSSLFTEPCCSCMVRSDLTKWRPATREEKISKPGIFLNVTPTPSALDTQIAGSHYKSKGIQPVEYISANNLNFLEGCIVKRITRWRDKQSGDKFDDLNKIKHEIDLLIEMEKEYGR